MERAPWRDLRQSCVSGKMETLVPLRSYANACHMPPGRERVYFRMGWILYSELSSLPHTAFLFHSKYTLLIPLLHRVKTSSFKVVLLLQGYHIFWACEVQYFVSEEMWFFLQREQLSYFPCHVVAWVCFSCVVPVTCWATHLPTTNILLLTLLNCYRSTLHSICGWSKGKLTVLPFSPGCYWDRYIIKTVSSFLTHVSLHWPNIFMFLSFYLVVLPRRT